MCTPCQQQKLQKLGVWGGQGGNAFDDGIYDGVKKIKICGSGVIDSIQVTYFKDSCEIVAAKHGGDGGIIYPEIVLSPGEKIMSIIGSIGTHNGSTNLVKSLVITTNKAVYGPYGQFDCNNVKNFYCNLSNLKVVGFYGKSGQFLDSLGVVAKTDASDLYPY